MIAVIIPVIVRAVIVVGVFISISRFGQYFFIIPLLLLQVGLIIVPITAKILYGY